MGNAVMKPNLADFKRSRAQSGVRVRELGLRFTMRNNRLRQKLMQFTSIDLEVLDQK